MAVVELSVPAGIVPAVAAFTIDNEAQPALNDGLLSAVIEESTEGLYHCEARFGNLLSGEYRYFDRELLDFGKEMAVTMGADDGEAEVFRGAISALEGQFLPGQSPQIVAISGVLGLSGRVVQT